MERILFNEQENLFNKQTGLKFEETYTKYYPKLVYYVNKMCRDEQTAEDIAMDSFIMALNKIEKYDREKSQFSTWLFTIAKNITLQLIKVNKRSVSIDNEIDKEGTTMKDFIETDDNFEEAQTEDVIEKKAEIMKREMERLKEPYKSVIEMREIERMAYKDISDKLGRNLSTVKSQIRGARKILRSTTEREFGLIDQMYA